MRIRITGIDQVTEDSVAITFQANIGSGKAIWHGSLPHIDQEYDVEIDIPDMLRWGQNIYEAREGQISLSASSDSIQLRGQVEQVDEDGCVALRIESSLMLVSADIAADKIGKFVKITTHQIEFYDTNI